MAVIGEKTFEMIREHVRDLCECHGAEIDQAYLKQEKALTVNFSVHLSPGKAPEDVIVETGISFVARKIKDSLENTVSERQGTMFGSDEAA